MGYFSKENRAKRRAARNLKSAHRNAKATSKKPVTRKKDQSKTLKSVSKLSGHHTYEGDKVETKGGDFPVYKKESDSAMSFRDTFAASRGQKDFTWQGRKYSTRQAGEGSNWNEETKKWDS